MLSPTLRYTQSQLLNTMLPFTALRISIGSALLATCVATNLLARAQSGPGWEVPVHVVWALTFGPVVSIVLIVIASVALFFAWTRGNISRSAIISTVVVLLTAVVLTATITFFEPEQWPIRNPNASALATVVPWPTLVVAGVVFWLVGFYGNANSAYRGVLGALFVTLAYAIAVLFFLAGMYGMYPFFR